MLSPATHVSTSLVMAGARTMDRLDMVLPCIALGLTFFGSIGFARDQVSTLPSCDHHVTIMWPSCDHHVAIL